MIPVKSFIQFFPGLLAKQIHLLPWEITASLSTVLTQLIAQLDDDYEISDGVAVHKTAVVEKGAVLKGPVIIGANCFIGSHAYLRNGVYLDENVKIGTGCEIKTSIISRNSSVAHFNFIGDSIIGSDVNFEAGSITANHYNERTDKTISVVYHSELIATEIVKFGSLVGDYSKIGANAVLSPGTILPPHSIVKRLELVNQQEAFSNGLL